MSEEALVKSALRRGATATEDALSVVAENGGDLAVEKIVQDMTPGELMTVVGDFDMTKPSVVSHHLTTNQFLSVVDRIGLFLSEIGDEDFDLRMIQSRIESILVPALAMGRDVFYHDRLEFLLDYNGGIGLLALLAIDQQDYEKFVADPEKAMAWHGTWQEIFAEVAYNFPQKYQLLIETIESINDEPGHSEDDDVRQDKIVEIINSLVYKARDLMSTEKPDKSEALVFVDL